MPKTTIQTNQNRRSQLSAPGGSSRQPISGPPAVISKRCSGDQGGENRRSLRAVPERKNTASACEREGQPVNWRQPGWQLARNKHRGKQPRGRKWMGGASFGCLLQRAVEVRPQLMSRDTAQPFNFQHPQWRDLAPLEHGRRGQI